MKRKYYRVEHRPAGTPLSQPPIVVEGYANSPYHACKLAFREMVKEQYIRQPPLFDNEREEFPNTIVEIIPEPEREPE